ncbi:MAG: hypothetical protein CL608_12105 [Anaerolineaceae bacterium]|nr:hypothetical protein [Anaerolineaceae bacterium]
MNIGALNPFSNSLTTLLRQQEEGTTDKTSFGDLFGLKREKKEDEQQGEQQTVAEFLNALSNKSSVSPNQLKPATEEPAAKLPLEKLSLDLAQSKQDFQTKLNEKLAALGINPAIGFEIQSDLNGQPVVTSDHPRQAEVNQLLASDRELNQLYRQMSAQASLQQAAAEHQAFAQAYQQNPTAAIEQFQHLFNPSGFRDFGVKFEQGKVEIVGSEQLNLNIA